MLKGNLKFNLSTRETWNFFGGGIVGALLATTVGAGLLYLKFGLGLVHASYDWPYAIRPVIQPQQAVMVYLDDESHQILNQPFNAPWDRSLHARLINRLTAEGARAVVFDIVFSDPGPDPQADKELADAIRANGRVVLAADYVPAGYGREVVEGKQIVPPYAPFRDAAATIGSAEMNPDDDLVLRQHLPMSRDDQIDSLSWAAATIAGAAITKGGQNRYEPRWLGYYGPATTIPNVSFYRAVLTNSPDCVPAGFFSNKVVFVGAHLLTKFSGERKDEFPTPHSRWAGEYPFMPGVELQATAFLNLLRGDWLNRLPQTGELAILLICGALFGFGLARFRPLAATVVSILLAALVCILAYLSFAHLRIWFPWLLLLAEIFIALAWSVVFNSIRLYVQKKLLEQALARYLSPKLVKKFAGRPDLIKPGAAKQMLTILFSDIANFTAISEGIDSDELANLMNHYFERSVSECIHRTDGTVVKYIGDAIFAFWNAPEQQSDHALRACEAALHFRGQGVTLVHGQPLYTRIGLHTGVANVGNFGSSTRMDYTAIGENINLASRMEGLNKHLGTQTLITGETKNEIGDRLVTRPLGRFQLKGFEKNVEVFELLGRLESAEGSQPLRAAFALALRLFQEKKFDEAEAAFGKVLEIEPNDGPAKFYLKQTAGWREQAPPEDWSGEVELKEK
jgi:adenylate cyclase